MTVTHHARLAHPEWCDICEQAILDDALVSWNVTKVDCKKFARVILNGGDLDGQHRDIDGMDRKNPPAELEVDGITFRLMDSWPYDASGYVRYLAPIDVREPGARAVRPHTT